MKLRTILAATVIGAMAAPGAAMAQTPPVSGGTDIGGTVNSFLELILTQPAKGFAAFSKTKSYEMSFDAQITATDPGTQLSLADGDATSGSKLGHLSVGSKRLPSPLEAAVGKSAFQPLDGSVDPLLTKLSERRHPLQVHGQAAPEGQGQGHGQLPQAGAGHPLHRDAVVPRVSRTTCY